ncbi:T9SS type A sorting domain-containing protein [bacterium]|nr:T9SS type A sorting domain-containing protein [bacterium]
MHGRTAYLIMIAGLLCSFSQAYAIDPGYHDNQEIYDEITAWADSLPDLVRIDTIGYSHNDHLPIWGVKISNNVHVDEDEATVLFVGNIHAEELIGTEIIMAMIDSILTYRFSSFPVNYADWIFGLEMWFIPTINPEGHQVVMDEIDTSFRKNKHDCNQNGIFDYQFGVGGDIDGVDMNRNFPLNWVKGDTFMQTGGNEYYDYFRGFEPLSEAETQALWDLGVREKFSFSVSWHSARQGTLSEQIFYPWNWYPGKYSPDSFLIQNVGNTMASLIQVSSGGSSYTPSFTAGDRGNQHDSFYAWFGTNSYLIEAGPGIQSPYTIVKNIVEENLEGVYFMLDRAAGLAELGDNSQLTGTVIDAVTGAALAAEVKIPQLHNAYLQPRICDSTYGRYRRYLRPGSYDLEVRLRGYEPHIATGLAVNPGGARTYNVQLTPKPVYYFGGKVLSIGGDPLAGTLYINGIDVADTLVIGSNGEFTHHLPEGDYELIFDVDGKVVRFDYLTLDQARYIEFELSDAEIVFFDDFESGISAWTEGGDDPDWGTEISDSLWDGSMVLSDKPYYLYDGNEENWVELANPLDLSDKTTASLRFDHWYYFEPGYDSCWVEVSDDDGGSWMPLTSGFWGQDIGWGEAFASLDDYCGSDDITIRFMISTDGTMNEEGWRIDNVEIAAADTVVGVDPQPDLPPSHLLYALYPNPFNSDLSISLDLPSTQTLSVSIWDIAGRQVAEIYSGNLSQGGHRLAWHAENNVTSGLYFVRIETEAAVNISKVLYLK